MNLANAITALRIVLSLVLIALEPLTLPFLTVYGLCGLTDMADGPIARKTGTESAFGERFDSIADLVFVAVTLVKVLPSLEVPAWAWICAGLIALIKAVNVISGFAVYKRPIFPHTPANKAAGAVLFFTVFLLALIPIEIACVPGIAVAAYAAVQEGHLIRTGNVPE